MILWAVVDPYSASKGAAELITSSYKDSFFDTNNHKISISTIRAGNILGGGDWAKDRIIPDSINAIDQKIIISKLEILIQLDPGNMY